MILLSNKLITFRLHSARCSCTTKWNASQIQWRTCWQPKGMMSASICIWVCVTVINFAINILRSSAARSQNADCIFSVARLCNFGVSRWRRQLHQWGGPSQVTHAWQTIGPHVLAFYYRVLYKTRRQRHAFAVANLRWKAVLSPMRPKWWRSYRNECCKSQKSAIWASKSCRFELYLVLAIDTKVLHIPPKCKIWQVERKTPVLGKNASFKKCTSPSFLSWSTTSLLSSGWHHHSAYVNRQHK